MPAHQPNELHTLFAHAFNRGDVDELLTLYEPNATIIVGGEPATGHDRVMASAEAADSVPVRRGLSTEVARQRSDGTWRFVIDNPDTPF
jgi:ketosteroid isomerase-like protein